MNRRDPYTGISSPIIAVIDDQWMTANRGATIDDLRKELLRQGVDTDRPYRQWRGHGGFPLYFENTEGTL